MSKNLPRGAWQATWPVEVEKLEARIARLEIAAEGQICNVERRAELRQQARLLTAELEAAKAAVLGGEIYDIAAPLEDDRGRLLPGARRAQ